jgi:hypothetical protein
VNSSGPPSPLTRGLLRQSIFTIAVRGAVSLIALSGRGKNTDATTWQYAWRAARRFAHLGANGRSPSRLVQSHGPPTLSRSTPSARDLPRAPSQVLRLHGLSSLLGSQPFKLVWSRSWGAATDFCRRSARAPNGASAHDNQLTAEGEAISALANPYDHLVNEDGTRDGFEHITPTRLALPPVGHVPAELRGLLQWPFADLFADDVLQRCRLTSDELAALPPAPRGSSAVYLEGSCTYAELVKILLDRSMVVLYDADDAPPGPDNGLFAVYKDGVRQRLILNNIPGNRLWSLARLQREYTAIISADPARADALGLGPHLMPMPGPDDVINGPAATLMAGSDFENCFYSIKQLPLLHGSQRLPRIAGSLVGRPECAFVVPVLTVASMGGWFSALLCQTTHRAMKEPLRACPLCLRMPASQSLSRRRVVDALAASAGPDGCVPWAAVPTLLRRSMEARDAGVCLLPDDLQVPVAAFELEVLDATGAAATPPEDIVEVRTHLLRDAASARLCAAQVNDQRCRTKHRLVLAVACLYLDDDGTFYSGGRRDRVPLVNHAACAHYLLMVAAPLRAGMKQSWKKLRWPSPERMVLLGLELTICKRGLRGEVAPVKRATTARQLYSLAARQGDKVRADHFASVLGNVTWQLLPARHLLSALFHVYEVQPRGKIWPGRTLEITAEVATELWNIAGLLIFSVGWSRKSHPTLATYDACGSNKWGNGGFGVALRAGLHPREAAELATVVATKLGRLPAYDEVQPGQPPAARLALVAHAPAARKVSKLLAHDHTWTALENRGWRAALEGEFPHPPGFIAIGESIAGALTVAVMVRDATVRGCRLTVGGDNTAASAALRKGRSSCKPINGSCRRAAVVCILHDVVVDWFWVGSNSNPSDGPSRWWYLRAQARRRHMRQLRRGLHLNGPNHQWQEDLTVFGCVEKHPGPPRRAPLPAHPYNGRDDRPPLQREGVSLTDDAVKPRTLQKYRTALRGLTAFLRERADHYASYADALRGYVEAAHVEEFATLSDAKTVLTAVAYFNPEAAADKTLKFAWKAVKGWERRQPGVSHKPIPEHLLDLFSVACARADDWDGAVALQLAIHIYARPGDIEGMRLRHLLMPGDLRSLLRDTAQVRVKDKRTGKDQTVIIDSPAVVAWLRWFLRWRRARGLSQDPSALLFRLPDGSMNTLVRRAQYSVGFAETVFVGHGCRHSGASRDFTLGRRPILDIMVRGRWKHRETCERYLQAAQATLLSLSLPASVDAYFAGDLGRAGRELRRLRLRCA